MMQPPGMLPGMPMMMSVPPMMGGWPGADPHVSPQFTHPTKVIHLRNLPFDLTVEEVRELCAPFGTVVAVKDKVGGMRNQAFVEFASLEQAVAIVSHYQRSPQPALIRGRPTWLSFSGRDRLTNVSPTTDAPTPVLQVSINNIPADLAPTLTLDLVGGIFSPYGYVKKMVTYNKPEGGMLAWVQFPDAQTAAAARAALQGQPVPAHLINQHPSPPILEMVFSTHPDLNIRTQSYCTRDYGNAALPWGEPDWAMVQALLPSGPEGASNVLSVSFDSMTYPVTVDGIHTIFSTYGYVQKIHIFERDGRTTALVQYPDVRTADVARAALQGHAMYDGGHNKMHVVYSKHRNLTIRPGERSRDYTNGALPNGPLPGAAPPASAAAPVPGAPRPPAAPAGAPVGMHGRPAPPPGGPPPPRPAFVPPPAGPPPQHPPAVAPPPYGAPSPAQPPRVDPHFHVSGEEFVKQHERVLEQYGGRTSGRGAPAPYAAGPYGAAYTQPAPPAPAAYGAQPAAAGYAPPPAPPAPPAPSAYGAQPAYGGYAQPAPAYGGPPPPAPAYGAAPAAGYGAAQAAPYGAAAGAPAAPYGTAPPAPAAYGGYAAQPLPAVAQMAPYGQPAPPAAGTYAGAPYAGY